MDFIPLEKLAGKWHIAMTNFPMWLKGDKTNPAFNYSLKTKGKIPGLKDEVTYLKKGKIKSIVGFDTPDHEKNTEFVWRGTGLLSMLSSKWKILHFSEKEGWALIFFERTSFTPEGFDVITKVEKPNQKTIQHIRQKMHEMEINTPLKDLQNL
jgi:hypothetical protein